VRENDGRKLDHRTLEVLPLRAVEQVQAGAHPEEVARTLGLHRKTVYGWLAKFASLTSRAAVADPAPAWPPARPGTWLNDTQQQALTEHVRASGLGRGTVPAHMLVTLHAAMETSEVTTTLAAHATNSSSVDRICPTAL
jgi:hypothetical protein